MSLAVHTDKPRAAPPCSPTRVALCVGVLLVAGAGAGIAITLSGPSPPAPPPITFSSLPGSKYHTSGDCGPVATYCGNVATWWGHNMAKLAKAADGTLYSGYLDNSLPYPTVSEFVVLRKPPAEGSAWAEGHRLPASRPANVLVDANGHVHVLIFEPYNVSIFGNGVDDSKGRLKHYFFANGDTSASTALAAPETVIDNTDGSETVNVRIGAGLMGTTLLFAFGLTTNVVPGPVQAEHLYLCAVLDAVTGGCAAGWTSVIGTGSHDMYYPYAVVRASGSVVALPTQDDYYNPPSAPAYNLFQKIFYFEKEAPPANGGLWSSSAWAASGDVVADLTGHALAATRHTLLEAMDLFEDSNGAIHVIWREHLDPANEFSTSGVVHAKRVHPSPGVSTFATTTLSWSDPTVGASLNWVRLAEVEVAAAAGGGTSGAELFYVAASYDKLYLGRVPSSLATPVLLKDVTPSGLTLQGPYIYTARSIAGGAVMPVGMGLDVLLLSGNSNEYPDAPNVAVHIPREQLDLIP